MSRLTFFALLATFLAAFVVIGGVLVVSGFVIRERTQQPPPTPILAYNTPIPLPGQNTPTATSQPLPTATAVLPTQTSVPPSPVPPTPTPIIVLSTQVNYILALTDVNIRSGPGTSYSVVGWVANGQTARVTGINPEASWWRVVCPNGSVGSCWMTAARQYTQPTAGPIVQPPTAVPCFDAAAFVADISIPDNSVIPASSPFVKTWRIRNSGTCSWNGNYALVFKDGNIMAGPGIVPMPVTVAPGQTVDFSLNLVSPANNGTHRGNWQLRNDKGVLFGVGNNAPLYVQIVVNTNPPPTGMPTISGWIFSDYCEIIGGEGGNGSPVGGCVPDGNSWRANGVLDPGESGIPGVTVQLVGGHCPSDAPQVAATVTDAQGRYSFKSLPLGNYCVTIGPTHPANTAVLLPGRFTMPGLDLGYINATLVDQRQTIFADFGWDHQFR